MNHQDLMSFLGRHRQGLLSHHDAEVLKTAVQTDPALAQLASDELRFDTDIGLALRGLVADDLSERVMHIMDAQSSGRQTTLVSRVQQSLPPSKTGWQLRLPRFGVAIAAGLVALIGIATVLGRGEQVGTLDLPPAGWHLRAKACEITAHSLELSREDGLRVIANKGALLATDTSPATVRLLHGVVTVKAPPTAVSSALTFALPQLIATVVGTQFTLSVGVASTVAVSEGVVQVHDLATGHNHRVAAGERITLGALGEWAAGAELERLLTPNGGQFIAASAGDAATAGERSCITPSPDGAPTAINFRFQGSEIIDAAQFSTVELEVRADQSISCILVTGNGGQANEGHYSATVQAMPGWRTIRIPKSLFVVNGTSTQIRRMVLSTQTGSPLAISRLAFVGDSSPVVIPPVSP